MRDAKPEGAAAWLIHAAITLGVGLLLWVPVAGFAEFIISPVVRDMLDSGVLLMSKVRFRLVMITYGAQGLFIAAALISAATVFGGRARIRLPVWAQVLVAVPVALVLAAMILPPDIVAQLYFIVCCMIAALASGLVRRRRLAGHTAE